MRPLIVAAVCAVLAACSPSEPAAKEGETLVAEITSPVEAAAEQDAAEGLALDPSALDLSQIALAMRIPSVFVAREEGAYLQINVTNPRLGVNIAEEFALLKTADTGSAFLSGQARDGYTIWTYGTRPEDGDRLRAVSAELARLKAEAPGENELSFGAIAPGCWDEAAPTPGSLKRTMYLRISPETDFELFVPEQEIGQGEMPGHESYWAACES